jgi:serine protease Do
LISCNASLCLVLGLATIAADAGCRRRHPLEPAPKHLPKAGDSDAGAQPILPPVVAAPPDFSRLVERVARSVVHLRADGPVRGGPADWLAPTVAATSTTSAVSRWSAAFQRSLGSGVLVDRRGHVLTNLHLVGSRAQVEVSLHGDSAETPKRVAQVIGRDELTDLALLRIDSFDPGTTRATPAKLGHSGRLAVGQWLVLVANPFGIGANATVGLLSGIPTNELALARNEIWSFYQTSLTIHAGNSGGPVFSTGGELVGIATAVREETTGVGFVVPTATARQLLPQLIRDGRVRRSWAGMYVEPVDEERAFKAGLERVAGGLISAMIAGGPAQKAGLERGDIILSFDGRPVERARDLSWMVATAGIGRTVPIEVWRSGQRITYPMTMQARPE